MARHIAASSSRIRFASSSRRCFNAAASSDEFSSATRTIRSSAQLRLTAVGRAEASCAVTRFNSARSSRESARGEVPDSQHRAHRPGDADRRRAAHLQAADRLEDLLRRAAVHHPHFARERRLVNDPQAAVESADPFHREKLHSQGRPSSSRNLAPLNHPAARPVNSQQWKGGPQVPIMLVLRLRFRRNRTRIEPR